MTKRLIAVMALSFALSACESNPPENTPTTNTNPPSATASPTPATISTPAADSSPAATAGLKAGDKVKVNNNGTTVEATLVSVDEKAGKVVIRLQGDKQDKTISVADIVRK